MTNTEAIKALCELESWFKSTLRGHERLLDDWKKSRAAMLEAAAKEKDNG